MSYDFDDYDAFHVRRGLLKATVAALAAGAMPVIPAIPPNPAVYAAPHERPSHPGQERKHAMTLNARQQSLTLVASYAAQGKLAELKTALNLAFDQKSLTVNEVRDALVQLYAYCGFPRSLNALAALSETLKARQAVGKATDTGRTAARLSENHDALKEGTKTQTGLTGGTVDLTALSPDIDRYLKTHLFGDIFASDLFNWQEREIITLAALGSMTGVESQFEAHKKIGMHNGLSETQIEEIVRLIATAGR